MRAEKREMKKLPLKHKNTECICLSAPVAARLSNKKGDPGDFANLIGLRIET